MNTVKYILILSFFLALIVGLFNLSYLFPKNEVPVSHGMEMRAVSDNLFLINYGPYSGKILLDSPYGHPTWLSTIN